MSGLYRSHTFNHRNTKDYIGVNDPYVRKAVPNSRWKSKQFQTAHIKKGQTEGYFQKASYASDVYQSNKAYIQIEPLKDRKMGFGSHDARRRDEFSSDVRTRQWREKLQSENVYTEVQGDLLPEDYSVDPVDQQKKKSAEYKDFYRGQPHLFQTRVPFYTYDIGREEKTSTPICNKCSKDTFYCKHRVGRKKVTLRRPGTAPTAYGTYGNWDDSMPQADSAELRGPRFHVQKPRFGHLHSTNSFYDDSHLGVL